MILDSSGIAAYALRLFSNDLLLAHRITPTIIATTATQASAMPTISRTVRPPLGTDEEEGFVEDDGLEEDAGVCEEEAGVDEDGAGVDDEVGIDDEGTG